MADARPFEIQNNASREKQQKVIQKSVSTLAQLIERKNSLTLQPADFDKKKFQSGCEHRIIIFNFSK